MRFRDLPYQLRPDPPAPSAVIDSVKPDTVDFACHTVGPIRHEAKAFDEVKEAIHTLSVAVQHDEHRTGAIFRPREQKQMIGAEVERGWRRREKERKWDAPAASAAPSWG